MRAMTTFPEPMPVGGDSLAIPSQEKRRVRVRARSEASLIRGALSGSEADLEALFRAHWLRGYRAAFLIVHDHGAAEDIAQEAFVQAIRRLDRFDLRRPFGPWFAAIVANRAIDWTRARAARPGLAYEAPELVAPDDLHIGRYSEEILAALAELTPEHRAVVVLRYVLDYKPGEIARVLELPRGTVNSRLRRGLDVLERRLERGEPR